MGVGEVGPSLQDFGRAVEAHQIRSQLVAGKALLGLRSKSQIAIDVLVRNLFERTADIGFLSTDDDIREFASHCAAAAASSTSIALHVQQDCGESPWPRWS